MEHYICSMDKHIGFFKELIGNYCLSDEATLQGYSHDETEDIRVLPLCVLKPGTVDEVSKILAYCNANQLPVTPMGARTGLSGGAIPAPGGVALSMERFNRILAIDENNMLETHTLQKISLEWLNWNSQFFDYSEEPYLFYLAELLAKDITGNNAGLLSNTFNENKPMSDTELAKLMMMFKQMNSSNRENFSLDIFQNKNQVIPEHSAVSLSA